MAFRHPLEVNFYWNPALREKTSGIFLTIKKKIFFPNTFPYSIFRESYLIRVTLANKICVFLNPKKNGVEICWVLLIKCVRFVYYLKIMYVKWRKAETPSYYCMSRKDEFLLVFFCFYLSILSVSEATCIIFPIKVACASELILLLDRTSPFLDQEL